MSREVIWRGEVGGLGPDTQSMRVRVVKVADDDAIVEELAVRSDDSRFLSVDRETCSVDPEGAWVATDDETASAAFLAALLELQPLTLARGVLESALRDSLGSGDATAFLREAISAALSKVEEAPHAGPARTSKKVSRMSVDELRREVEASRAFIRVMRGIRRTQMVDPRERSRFDEALRLFDLARREPVQT